MPPPVTLTFDPLTLKSVWESHVTWGTPVQSFVFLGLLVFELEPMYATSDRRTTDVDHRLMPPGGGLITDQVNFGEHYPTLPEHYLLDFILRSIFPDHVT